jgi:photosystem II stability/assembly factor-like uncharacterized protein
VQNLHAVVFSDQAEGWVVGAGDTVLHSADGGFSWSLRPPLLPGQRHTWYGVSFLNRTMGCVCGNYGAVLCTSDAGAT